MKAVVKNALDHRVLIAILFLFSLAGGLFVFQRLNIEAYPDPTPPMVDIVTQVEGLSAEEIERYITIPIEIQMAGMPNLKVIRTVSLFGLSDVKLQFTFDYSYEQAQQQVLNRLSQLPELPNKAQPQISPVSPIGEIFRYRIVGPTGYTVLDFKTIQDWQLERRFRAVPGVIDVIGWGGKTKTYEVNLDSNKLVALKVSRQQILDALRNSNLNVGGSTVNIGPQSAVIRAIGQIRSIDDILSTLVTQANGSPILIKDIATVTIGHKPRLGIAGFNDDDDIVQGIVLMRRGEKSMPTIKRVEAEVEKINSGNILPLGMKIVPIYDRKELIEITTHTVIENLLMGISLIVLLQWIFLGNLRSAIIVAATIPFALFFAVALLVAQGQSANLLSVGAIDFGLIVDATVVMVERIMSGLAHAAPRERTAEGKLASILESASSVSQSIFFASAIIIVSFVPLFAMQGVEGHIFGPMAKTYAYAIVGGLIATFTVTPALSALLLKAESHTDDTLIVRLITRLYEPVLRFSVRARYLVIASALALTGAAFAAIPLLGLEFLPKLEEGNMWIRASLPPTISLEEANPYANDMRRLIASFPEVETVVSQHGRPDDGTDAAGFFNVEFFVPLKNAGNIPGFNKEDLTRRMLEKLQAKFPGVEFNFSQYLQDNVAEAVSGVKGENSIKLFGNDLKSLTETGARIGDVMKNIPGVVDLSVFAALGQPTLQIEINRELAARYGLSPGDINTVIKTAIGGEEAGDVYEEGSDRHFPIVVRLASKYRQTPEAIRNLTITMPGPNGVSHIPLKDVADVKLVSGASYIYREQQQRYLPIKFGVRDRDLGSTVQDAQNKIAAGVPLAAGSRLEWVGEFGNLQDAIDRLSVIVPVSIALIAVLLFMNFNSARDTILALTVIPMASVGGVIGLFVTGIPFSISAAIGFIALFGIAIMDGIIVITDFNARITEGRDRASAITEACKAQLRPVVMTCMVAGIGLLPAALATGVGSQVQKPLAVVVVSGMLFAPFFILVILPALLVTFSDRTFAPARPVAGSKSLQDAGT